MADDSIIRGPQFSEQRVTVGAVRGQQPVHHNVHTDEPQDVTDTASNPAQGHSENPKLDYESLLSMLEQDRIDIEAEKARLQLESEKLALEKEQYREQIAAEAREEIEARVRAEYHDAQKELGELIDSIAESRLRDLENIDDEIMATVYSAVCKIVGSTVMNEDVVLSTVKQVIQQAQDRMNIVLRVNPAHAEIIRAAEKELNRGINNRIEVVPDEYIRYGGCIVETDAGSIDGRLDRQFQSLLDLITTELERNSLES